MAAHDATWKVSVDLTPLVQVGGRIGEQIEAALHDAVGEVALETHAAWRDAVMQAKLWVGEKSPYFESIGWRFTGKLSAEVWTDYNLAGPIETGRPTRDLKRMLDTSMKVRTTSEGRRYLVIPFRHNMTSLQAAGVYQQAKALTPSHVTGVGKRLSGTGAWDVKTKAPAMVASHTYSWGGRLTGTGQKNLEGMVRFNTSAGKGKSSAYLTFRTMWEGAPGWIVPAKPGLYIAKAVATKMQAGAEQRFKAALVGS